MKYSFNGKLELNDNNQYIVNGQNISEILHKQWQNEIPAQYLLIIDGKEVVSEECVLLKKKYKGLLYDFHADEKNLENNLFKNVGRVVDFSVEEVGTGYETVRS